MSKLSVSKKPTDFLDRRTVIGGGLALGSAFAVAALQSAAQAAPSQAVSTREQDNIAFVTRFCQAWESRDVEQIVPFVADTLEYHVFEGGPVVKGLEQLRAQMGPFMAGMQTITWEIKRSAAMGDIVINERIDNFIQKPGSKRPDSHFEIVGVFLIRDGKIQYWKDYNMPKAG